MSQDSNLSDTPSPSLLNNLRQFRFQKRASPKLAHPNNGTVSESPNASSPDVEIIMHRKKAANCLQYSDSEDEVVVLDKQEESVDSKPPSLSEKDIADKEINLTFLCEVFPDVDKMTLQDVLVSTNWNTADAMAKLNKGLFSPQKKRPLEQDIYHTPPRKKAKEKDVEVDKDEVGNDSDALVEDNVYDSDDSDQEVTDELTEDKKRVLDFLSTATAGELRAMPSCTQKKVDAIIDQRPFLGWKDLVEKFQTAKYLGTYLLNAAKELLHIRQDLESLMRKCMKLAKQMERAVLAGSSSVKQQPSLLSSVLSLTGYQLIGLNWLVVMHMQELNGILADEMGLGKTVQVIAFLAHLKENNLQEGPHLVVVPSSTLENWRNEFKRWCPSLRVECYYGSFEERKAMRISWLRDDGLNDVDVILSVYGIVNSTIEDKKIFRVVKLHYVVLDEAHMLKNMTSLRYENLMRINAQHRILLTGTPVQNNLLELISLLIFVMPNMFAGKEEHLKRLFSKCPKQVLNECASDEDKMPQFERQQVDQARRIMKPFVLRRLKLDVMKDLPTKTDETVFCPLTESQQIKYDELVREYSESAGQESYEVSGMTMMMQLRKLANHPCLLRYHLGDDQVQEMAELLANDPDYKEDNPKHVFEDLAIMSDFQLHELALTYSCLSKYYLPESLFVESGKFKKMDELLPTMKEENHRILIFSQFVIMLDVMEEYLKARNYEYLRLDGSTPVTLRQELIDTYNEDSSIFVFLLSTRAGGMGINLTAADTVIIHDIDFNPYNDKQAEDRCHRVGQSRSVRVMRLVSKGTIEEGIYQAAQQKLTLEKEITGSTEGNETAETKNVLCLLKQALALDSNKTAKEKL